MRVGCVLLVFAELVSDAGEDVDEELSADLWADVAEEDLLVAAAWSDQCRVEAAGCVAGHEEGIAVYGSWSVDGVQEARKGD